MLQSQAMDETVRRVVREIHDEPGRLMMVIAGAGTQALASLLGVAGASRTLLEALIPYDEAAFNDFLGQRPAQYVSESTAGLLAGRALTRARQLCQDPEPLIGLSCSATIVTDRPKRGQHRAFIATWTAARVQRIYVRLKKGARDRKGEEGLVSLILLNALLRAYGLNSQLPVPLGEGDLYEMTESDLAGAAGALLRSEAASIGIRAEGHLTGAGYRPRVILSGAFNPLHAGHLALAEVAGDILGQPVTFELAAINAGKPLLNEGEILERMSQFAGRHTVLASNAPLFQAKARLYPGATFVIGFDTAVRVLQPLYYDNSEEQLLSALAEIRRQGCRFLVAGRSSRSGRFHEANELAVPKPFRDLFVPIPGQRFRQDISSTQLREEGKPGSR